MEQLIQSSDLFVMQVEMDVYTALKKVGDITYHSILRYNIKKSNAIHLFNNLSKFYSIFIFFIYTS